MSPLRQRWIQWLASPQARDPQTGLWLSWSNGDHPGFAYEEATAWVMLAAAPLRSLPQAAALSAAVDQAAVVLAKRIRRHGGLRCGGRRYAFDTAVALAAWQAWGGPVDVEQQLLATLLDFCRSRTALDGGVPGGDETSDTRWSESWGAHQLWLAGPLQRAGQAQAALDLVEELLPRVLRDDGLLRIHGASDAVYAHAALYGAAGLLAVGERGLAAGVAAEAMAALGGDGLVPTWLDPQTGPGRADATAQAAAITAESGAQVADELRARAVAALGACTTVDGGVRYEADSQDRNCCATAFCLRMG